MIKAYFKRNELPRAIQSFDQWRSRHKERITNTLWMLSDHTIRQMAQHTPVSSGRMVRSWERNITGLLAEIYNSAPAAQWLFEGTGLYGPRGRLILPVKARVLHITGNGLNVFAHFTRGIHPRDPTQFLDENQLRDLTERLWEGYLAELERV